MTKLILPFEPLRRTSDSNSWQSSHSQGTFIKLFLCCKSFRSFVAFLVSFIVLLKSTNVVLVDLVSLYVDIEPYLM